MSILRAVLALVLLGIGWGAGNCAVADRPITAADRAHWAFQKPVRPALPEVTQRAWVRDPMDQFILAALEENALKPAPEANREAWLRRVTFDLTGLPPTPEDRAAFLADRTPNAFERVVDRLLASPRYGERWAQHWLDLARFADTDGFEFDQARPDAWRFRDWVVAALNADMPYDRFVQLQLAGDEIKPDDSGAVVATGFNRCYPDMVDLNDQTLRRQNALNDITETTGLVFLGLTLGCARCHDHKTDPIPQEDFYRLQAFFTPARFRDDLRVGSAAERARVARRFAEWEHALTDAEAAILALVEPAFERLVGTPASLDDTTAAALTRPASERSPEDVRRIYDALAKDRRFKAIDWGRLLPPSLAALRAGLVRQVETLKGTPPSHAATARGIDEAGPNAPPTYLLRRGELALRGPEVTPRFPAVLSAPGMTPRIIASSRSTGRRSALADWLTQPDHPLTARVMVNRVWQHHFGRGIVATPSDFGVMGAEPTHPELLDWLAVEFVAEGWSLKRLHRRIVMSATYRQSTQGSAESLADDPDDELFSRFPRVRLDGEALRDALLSVSGRLSNITGGPPVYPELPAELTRLSSKGAVWPTSPTDEERCRRSLYVFIRRNLRYPFFEAFDRPDTNASCPRRSSTTIAPQALTLLNSAIAHDAARSLARRVAAEAGEDRRAQVEHLFLLAYTRRPDDRESALALSFLDRDSSLEHLCLAIINANEFVYLP